LQNPRTDWLKIYQGLDKRDQARLNAQRAAEKTDERPLLTNAPMNLKPFAGVYRDRWYGDVAIDLDRDGLRLLFTHSPRLIGSMLALSDHKFLIRWDDRTLKADALIEFEMDAAGEATGARMSRASAAVSKAYDYQDLHLLRVGGEGSDSSH
jgi:hypothetical protein